MRKLGMTIGLIICAGIATMAFQPSPTVCERTLPYRVGELDPVRPRARVQRSEGRRVAELEALARARGHDALADRHGRPGRLPGTSPAPRRTASARQRGH